MCGLKLYLRSWYYWISSEVKWKLNYAHNQTKQYLNKASAQSSVQNQDTDL